jgi:LPXTG-motif cell wall-anchored protein
VTRRSLAAVTLTLALGAGGSATAAHASDHLALSPDGLRWSPVLSAPLFEPSTRCVPGDSDTAAFYVRNQGPSAGTLRIEVRSDDLDHLLQNDDIRLQARTTGGSWVELGESQAPRRVGTSTVPARAQTRLEVRATFDARSGNQSQADRARLGLVVYLSGDSPSPGDGTPDNHTGPLPHTGADGMGWLLIIAAMSIGFGIALRRAGRQT